MPIDTLKILIYDPEREVIDHVTKIFKQLRSRRFDLFPVESMEGVFRAIEKPFFDLAIIGSLVKDSTKLSKLIDSLGRFPTLWLIQANLSALAIPSTARIYKRDFLTPFELEKEILGLTENIYPAKSYHSSENRLELALKAARMVSWDWDVRTDEMRYANNPSSVFGNSTSGLRHTYQTFLSYVHPEDLEAVANSIESILKEGTHYHFVFRIKWGSNSYRWVQSVAEVFRNEEEKAVWMTGVVMDITEQKLAEEEITALNKNLEQRVKDRTVALEAAVKELEAFTYSVSHDLKTPIQSIYGFVEILKSEFGSQLTGHGFAYLDRIRGTAERMTNLIDDMLALSRVARAELVLEEVNLSLMVREIVDELHTVNLDRDIQIEIEDNIFVIADKRLLKVALSNLIGNAWKYTSKTLDPSIQVFQAHFSGDQVIVIQDNGAGFDNSEAEKLFEPFKRLHRNRDFLGTGIGLATVSRVIERHGGSVWGNGQVNVGATFFFSLGTKITTSDQKALIEAIDHKVQLELV